MPAEEPSDESALARASERLKAAARETLTKEKARAAFANHLVAAGLAATFLAAGVDYFKKEDQIHGALAAIARDAGRLEVAQAIDAIDQTFDGWKNASLSQLPPAIGDHLALVTLLLGLGAISAGLVVKLKVAGEHRGQVARDFGRAIAGPGFLGIALFVFVTWRTSSLMKNVLAGFCQKLFAGELSGTDAWELVSKYAPWAWEDAGGVLLIGLALGTGSLFARWGEGRAPESLRLAVEVVRRALGWGALYALAFYALATFVAIATYGAGLRVLCWPWKIDPGAFLVGLALMGIGSGLARAGTRLLREQPKKDEKDER